MQFEYTTRELFRNHFPYWPSYSLTIRYTIDGEEITVTGADIDTGITRFLVARSLHHEISRYYADALKTHAEKMTG